MPLVNHDAAFAHVVGHTNHPPLKVIRADVIED